MFSFSKTIPLLVLLFLLMTACSAGISSFSLHEQLMAGQPPVIVDVRRKAEYERGHIAGAIHIPFYEVDERYAELGDDKDAPVVVYCAHGPRAWWAAWTLRRKGFSQVTTLEGHIKEWQQSGFAVERP